MYRKRYTECLRSLQTLLLLVTCGDVPNLPNSTVLPWSVALCFALAWPVGVLNLLVQCSFSLSTIIACCLLAGWLAHAACSLAATTGQVIQI